MKLTKTQITKLGVAQIASAQNLCDQLDQASGQIASHNADKNNTPIDATPFTSALAAGNQIVSAMAAHIQASAK